MHLDQPMECFVYILGSFDKSAHRTYVGWTTDLDRRLARHNAGTGARSTRGRVWVLLDAERHTSRQPAMSREWHLKRESFIPPSAVIRRLTSHESDLATKRKKLSVYPRGEYDRVLAKGAA
jgi:putative endonuclease